MKKVFLVAISASVIGALSLITAFAAVKDSGFSAVAQNAWHAQATKTVQTNLSTYQTEQEKKEGKVLIAYFSRKGNTEYPSDVDATTSASIVVKDAKMFGTTELVANMIKESVGGDLYAIETVENYPVDFDEVSDQNHKEQANGTKPKLKGGIENIEEYDVIFIGYPVWSSTAPAPVLSFLSQYDLSGKTVIPFCTHDGYGSGRSFGAVAAEALGATILDGISLEAVDVSSAKTKISQWANGLQIIHRVDANETNINIIIGDTTLSGTLNNSAEAQEFISMLPQTISMGRYGDREYYGSIDKEIKMKSQGKLNFENGDITYCPANNTAAIFFAQTARPNLSMEVFKMGNVTSDLSVFDNLESREDVRFELAN